MDITKIKKIVRTIIKAQSQELKRVEYRSNNKQTHHDSAADKFKIDPNLIVGWFSTIHNSFGYAVYMPNSYEKSEFGRDVVRLFNLAKNLTTIAKVNLIKGMVYFIDDKAYEEGTKKFQSPMKYTKFVIDDTALARNFFNAPQTPNSIKLLDKIKDQNQ